MAARFFAVAALYGFSSALAEEAAVHHALTMDDECAVGDTDCALNAIQLRGFKKATFQQSMGLTSRPKLAMMVQRFRRRAEPDAADASEAPACPEDAKLLQCMPAEVDNMYAKDIETLCKCGEQGIFATYKDKCKDSPLADMMDEFIGMTSSNGLCGKCGMAAVNVEFEHDHKCTNKDGGELNVEAACSEECHEALCNVLTECAAGTEIDGLANASVVDESRANITAATKSCPCPAAKASLVQTNVVEVAMVGTGLESHLTTMSNALAAIAAANSTDSCQAFRASTAKCVPSTNDPEKMTKDDVKKMCGCKDVYSQLATECPDLAKISDLMSMLLESLCSECGSAITDTVAGHHHKCVKDNKLVFEAACDKDCHDSICNTMDVCKGSPPGGLLTAESMQETFDNITEATKSCPCPAAKASLVQVKTETEAAVAVHRTASGHLTTLSTALITIRDEPDAGCEAFRAASAKCAPGTTDPYEMSMDDVTTMCGCKDTYAQMDSKCPDMKELSQMLNGLLHDICSTCGLSIADSLMGHDHKCANEDGLITGSSCGADCHSSVCNIMTACADDKDNQLFPADSIEDAFKNITAATKSCPCSSAK